MLRIETRVSFRSSVQWDPGGRDTRKKTAAKIAHDNAVWQDKLTVKQQLRSRTKSDWQPLSTRQRIYCGDHVHVQNADNSVVGHLSRC